MANWVCLYNRPHRQRQQACRPLAPAVPAEIGFVFPMSLVRSIHHNSFSPKHLPFVSLEGKLGLFGAISAREGPASEVPRPVPTWARIGRLGSFCIIRSRQLGLFVQPAPGRQVPRGVPPQLCPQSPIRNPKSAIEKLALFRTIGPRPSPTSNVKLHASNFSNSIRLPLLPAVLQESARKNGLRRAPKSP